MSPNNNVKITLTIEINIDGDATLNDLEQVYTAVDNAIIQQGCSTGDVKMSFSPSTLKDPYP